MALDESPVMHLNPCHDGGPFLGSGLEVLKTVAFLATLPGALLLCRLCGQAFCTLVTWVPPDMLQTVGLGVLTLLGVCPLFL